MTQEQLEYLLRTAVNEHWGEIDIRAGAGLVLRSFQKKQKQESEPKKKDKGAK